MILTRSRLPTFGLALFFLAATANGDSPTVTTFLDNGVTAHRGNSAEYPENTLPAFKSGIELGADWIELDVFRTKDGKLGVIHDRGVDRQRRGHDGSNAEDGHRPDLYGRAKAASGIEGQADG